MRTLDLEKVDNVEDANVGSRGSLSRFKDFVSIAYNSFILVKDKYHLSIEIRQDSAVKNRA